MSRDKAMTDLSPILGPTLSPVARAVGEGSQRARINLLSMSDEPPRTNATTTPGPTLNSQAAPDGSLTAWAFAGGTTGQTQRNITIPADVRPYTYTMRVKALSAGARVVMPSFGIFSVSNQNNGTTNAYYDFDTNAFGAGALDWYATPDSDGYILLRRTFVNNGAGTIFIHRIDSDATYSNAKVAYAWHQLEVGNGATAYQRTSATTAATNPTTFPLARAHAAWGDSLTAGSGDDAGSSYGKRLNTARKFNHYNGGVGGETSTQIKTRMLADTQGRNSWVNLFWLGRNNATSPATVKADIAACVANLYAGNDRYLVLGVLTSTADTAQQIADIGTLNADLAEMYGSRYLDVLAYLQSKGDGSANDIADVAAGYTPRSLRVDALHLNPAGYQHVADCVAAKLATLGY
jgi:lysophospholipase L1-like esterase